MVIVGGSGNNLGAVLGGFLIWWLWVQVEAYGLWLLELDHVRHGGRLAQDAPARQRGAYAAPDDGADPAPCPAVQSEGPHSGALGGGAPCPPSSRRGCIKPDARRRQADGGGGRRAFAAAGGARGDCDRASVIVALRPDRAERAAALDGLSCGGSSCRTPMRACRRACGLPWPPRREEAPVAVLLADMPESGRQT